MVTTCLRSTSEGVKLRHFLIERWLVELRWSFGSFAPFLLLRVPPSESPRGCSMAQCWHKPDPNLGTQWPNGEGFAVLVLLRPCAGSVHQPAPAGRVV